MADKCFKQCGLCSKRFNKPKILTCFHSFCEKCLEEHMQNTVKLGEFCCPICTTVHLIPTEGVKNNVSEPDATPKYYCKKHKEKELEFFCNDCRQAICGSCSIIQDHRSHCTVDLADVHKEFQKTLQSCTETLQDKIQQCRANDATLKMEIDNMKETAAMRCNDVDKQVQRIYEEAIRTGKGIKDEINTHCQEAIAKLTKQKKQIQVELDQLETAVSCTKQAMSTNTTKPLTDIAPHTQRITTQSREKCLDIEEVKIPQFQLKEFPKESMENLFGELTLTSIATFTRQFNMEEIKKEDNSYFSTEQKVGGLPLCVGIKKFTDTSTPTLGVHLYLNKVEGSAVKSCRTEFTAKLVHKADDKKSRVRKVLHTLEPGKAGYGWNAFIPWKDLIDPSNKFIDNNQLTLQIRVWILKIE